MAYIGNTNTTQAFTPAIDYFSGNGSTTAFTLSRPVASVAQVQVTIDNVAQNPSSAYTVSANTITFTSAPLSGTNNIYVCYTSPITQVIAPGQGTVGNTQMVSGAAVANIGYTPVNKAGDTGIGSLTFASNAGVTFNNSSGLTNSLLNDYEVGTYSPTYLVGASSSGVSMNTSYGKYVKIGSMAFVQVVIGGTYSGGTTNPVSVTLPFTNSSAGFDASIAMGYTSGWASGQGYSPKSGYMSSGANYIVLQTSTNSNAQTGTFSQNLQGTNMATQANLQFFICYTVAV